MVFLLLNRSDEYLRLLRQPSFLREKCGPLKATEWVVIDEVQRIPELLNEAPELVCIESKCSEKWDSRWNKPIDEFASHGRVKVRDKIGVYPRCERLRINDFEVWPASQFLEKLFEGKVF
jgi:hypothetical protein